MISAICLSLIACHSKKPAPATQAEKPQIKQQVDPQKKEPEIKWEKGSPAKSFYFDEIKAEISLPEQVNLKRLSYQDDNPEAFNQTTSEEYMVSAVKTECPSLDEINFYTKETIQKYHKKLSANAAEISKHADEGGDIAYPQVHLNFLNDVERVSKNLAPLKPKRDEWDAFTCHEIKTVNNRKYCVINHDQSEYGDYHRKFFTYINQTLVSLDFMVYCFPNQEDYNQKPQKDYPVEENKKLVDKMFSGVEIR